MNVDMSFLGSSIGRKIVMAITGILLLLFVIAHMIGNLSFFAGQDAINEYAHFLKGTPGLLWPARIGLLVVFVLHIVTAIQLKKSNFAARPVPYAYQATVQADLASRTMLITGMCVLLFVIYHLAHFTIGVTHPDHFNMTDFKGRHDVYHMVQFGFENALLAYGYVAMMLILGYHLSHGIASFFQTLGLNNPKHQPLIARGSMLLSTALVAGYIVVPLSIQLGIVK